MSSSFSPSEPRKWSEWNPSLLIVGNFLSQHGLSRCPCEEISARLKTRGWKVFSTSTFRNRPVRLADMLTTSITKAPLYDVAMIDVFSRDAFLWAEAVAWVMRRLGEPYVLALHGGGLPGFAASQPRRARRLLQPAAAVVAPSTFLKLGLEQYRDDIVLIPNAVDIAGSHFRARGPLSPRLVWLRAFHAMYAPEQAVQVLARVQRRFPTATLLMIGGDKGDGSLQRTTRLVQQLGLTNSVSFTGTIQKTDVPNWLNQGDIFLNTTTVDNMPVSVIEAMACGLCVVSTDPAGIPHLLDHGRTALLTPVGDVPALAEAVGRLLDNAALAQQLSLAGRSLVEPFDWQHVLPRWERVLRSAAWSRLARSNLSGDGQVSTTPMSILETAALEMHEPNPVFPACVTTVLSGHFQNPDPEPRTDALQTCAGSPPGESPKD